LWEFVKDMRDIVADNAGGFEELLSKTAKVTVFFWIMKVLATTLGERPVISSR
jgi:uncharacterized membrane-anchored protein